MPPDIQKENDMTPIEATQIKGLTWKTAVAIIATVISTSVWGTLKLSNIQSGQDKIQISVDNVSKRMDSSDRDDKERDLRYQEMVIRIKLLEARVDALERK